MVPYVLTLTGKTFFYHRLNNKLKLKNMTTSNFIYPELGEKTNATIEYTCSHGGGFYVTTDLQLTGRGIKMSGDGSTHKRGKKNLP